MVKDTGSKYFEGAYFVLRSEMPVNVRESEMINEARQMLGACTDGTMGIAYKAHKPLKPYIITIILLGTALAATLTALLLFLI